MFQCKNPKSLHDVLDVHKFRLRTGVSRDTWFSQVLNTQLPCVIAERAIHHGPVMDGLSFGQNQ